MGVRDSIKRVDAYDKVTGAAKYTADLLPAARWLPKWYAAPLPTAKCCPST